MVFLVTMQYLWNHEDKQEYGHAASVGNDTWLYVNLAFMLSGRKGVTSQFAFSFTATFWSSSPPGPLKQWPLQDQRRHSLQTLMVSINSCLLFWKYSVSYSTDFPGAWTVLESHQGLSRKGQNSGLRALAALTAGSQGNLYHAYSSRSHGIWHPPKHRAQGWVLLPTSQGNIGLGPPFAAWGKGDQTSQS